MLTTLSCGVGVLLAWLVTLTAGTDVSYLDRGLLEKDIAAVFNKVAYGGVTTTKRSISSKLLPVSGPPTTVAPPITSISVPPSPTLPPATSSPFVAPTTKFPPSFSTPSSREVPSYIPPIRSFFTPPLPPEYANPFADKPTLRGSNSDGSTIGGARRPIPPPPRPPAGRERIPLRPPDLASPVERDPGAGMPADRKKPLNTPSFSRAPEAPYSEAESPPAPNSRPANDSDFDFVPILHYPSVSRILSGSNGRKPSLGEAPARRPEVPRMPDMFPSIELEASVPRTAKKEASPPQQAPESPHTETPPQVERLPAPQPQPPKPEGPTVEVAAPPPARNESRAHWQLAWDVHVYLTGTLFALLAVVSAVNLARGNCRHLLPRSHYVCLHSLLLLVGALRSAYLFYDPYNLHRALPLPVSLLALNLASPLLTSAFLALLVFLARAGRVCERLERPAPAVCLALLHLGLCVGLSLAVGAAPGLGVACDVLLVGVCIMLGVVYLALYRRLAAPGADDGYTELPRAGLGTAVRATLATALLCLLLAAVRVYGLIGVGAVTMGSSEVSWLWWGFQFSCRVIEVSVGFLLSWAGAQRGLSDEKSGLALFRCGRCASTPRGSDQGDDIYPAVCVTNQAVQGYTARTGKRLYDDAFPLNTLRKAGQSSDAVFPERAHHSLRKSGTMASLGGERRLPGAPVPHRGGTQTLGGRGASPSSMLVAENGFVRFRALAEPEDVLVAR